MALSDASFLLLGVSAHSPSVWYARGEPKAPLQDYMTKCEHSARSYTHSLKSSRKFYILKIRKLHYLSPNPSEGERNEGGIPGGDNSILNLLPYHCKAHI